MRGRRAGADPTERRHSARELESAQVTTVAELSQLDASLGTGDAGILTLRGVDAQGPLTTDTEGLALVYLGGLRLPQFALRLGAISTWDLSELRVSRGPQLFAGRQAPIGAIHLEPLQPRESGDGRAALSLAVPLEAQSALATTFSAASGARVRVAALEHVAHGSVENPGQGRELWASERDLSGRALLRVALPGNAVLSAAAYGLRRSAGLRDVELGRAPEAVSLASAEGFERHRLGGATAALDYRPNARVALRVAASALRHDFRIRFDEAFSPRPDGYRQRALGVMSASLEPSLDYAGDGWALRAGAYADLELQEPDELLREASTDLGVARPWVRSRARLTRNTGNMAAYVRADWDVTSRLQLSAGARLDHTREHRDVAQDTERLTHHGALDPVIDAAISSLLPDSRAAASSRDTALLPQLSARWRPAPSAFFTLQARRGYRPGGLRHVPALGGFDAYRAEFLWSYDAGAELETPDGALRASLNLFYIDWTEQQVRVERDTLGLDARIVNAARSSAYGLEVAAHYRLTDDLTLTGGANLERAELSHLVDPVTGEDASGHHLPYARSVTLLGRVEYESFDGACATLSARLASGTYSDLANQHWLEPYGSLDGRAGWRFRRVALYVFASNLSDARAVLWRNETIGRALGVLQEPRQLGVLLDAGW